MYKTGCTNWMMAFDNPLNEIELKKRYHKLALKYHPDEREDGEDFKAISLLYSEGKAYFDLKNNKLDSFSLLEVRNSAGRGFDLKYILDEVIDSCRVFTSKSNICLRFIKDNKSFYDNYLKMLNREWKFPSDNAKKAFKNVFPEVVKTFDDGTFYYIVIKKTEEVLSLHDILKYYETVGMEWPERYRHSVWIINRLYSIECLMEFNELAFNGINTRNIYISPLYHTVLLYNGMQFCKEIDSKMLGTTKDIYDIMPINVKDSKKSSTITDLESIKLIGRTLFDKGAPKEFREFFERGSKSTALENWREFEKVTESVYGERKFIVFDINGLDVLLKISK